MGKAMQLDYSEAHKHLLQSARKAPQNSAAGFKQHVAKLSVTVDLLLGNIPERQTFVAAEVKQSLAPYLQLTQAVKTGDVGRFDNVVKKFAAQFQADFTYSLIVRLHHNVVKTNRAPCSPRTLVTSTAPESRKLLSTRELNSVSTFTT